MSACRAAPQGGRDGDWAAVRARRQSRNGGNKAKALQAGSASHVAKAILHPVVVSKALSRNSKAKRARSSGASDRERMQAGKGT